ncbi:MULTISPECIES: hypothetical protein [unclassified Clostridium]|uniref:hypothetical protein n=1 Tax=unclassified Clostridium TaxID=2614128 RepID=UPI0013FCC35A|nr:MULTISPECIES: hypothetical protein [unclassified Clostridium]NFR85436.1 hypothetical protein [Clostridium botulinum]NFR90967.1 hypothetical protein [Clostridium botulinum]NFT99889.1 hypothetical protein [Clostridium botulinum]
MDSYFDLDDLQKECINFMHNSDIPNMYINKWKNFSLSEDEDFEDYESTENLILREIIGEEKTTFYLKDNADIKLIIKKELYKILCTDSNEYNKERNMIIDVTGKIIPVLSTTLASRLGQDIAIMTGVVSIVICGFFKFGKNVWCNCYKEQFGIENQVEK